MNEINFFATANAAYLGLAIVGLALAIVYYASKLNPKNPKKR